MTSLWSLLEDLASLYLLDLLAALTVGRGVPPAWTTPLPHAPFVSICLAALSLAPRRLLPFAAPYILMSLRFCVDRLPSWLPHSSWGDSSVTYLFLCWHLPSLSSGPQIQESTCLLGPTERPKLNALNNPLPPPSRPLPDQAPRSITLDSSGSFPLSSPTSKCSNTAEEFWNPSFTALHLTAWLRPPGGPICSSRYNQTHFSRFWTKYESDQFISVLNSPHAFLLVIMIIFPLFSLLFPSYIFHLPPAHMLSNATFTSGFDHCSSLCLNACSFNNLPRVYTSTRSLLGYSFF